MNSTHSSGASVSDVHTLGLNVDHGNFTRAAQDVHISQPTLSQQIQQLERAIGAQLLDRSGRSVRLTDAGHAYLAHARRALRELAAGERAVHDALLSCPADTSAWPSPPRSPPTWSAP
jgi:hypothetical protein